MTSYVENETEVVFPFPVEDLVNDAMNCVLKMEQCSYEATVNVLLTDNEGIRELNREYRNLDRETDVLSFPNIEFLRPADFSAVNKDPGSFDPDSKELLLGDIILSVDKVLEQADSYGHSVRREFAFLVVHSLLHLCGYDHMQDGDAQRMEERQKMALDILQIGRDS